VPFAGGGGGAPQSLPGGGGGISHIKENIVYDLYEMISYPESLMHFCVEII
jgi:hypothetical protein